MIPAQRFDDTQTHEDARPGSPIAPTTIQQTATELKDESRSITRTTENAMPTNRILPGCSRDCTYDMHYMTMYHLSWTKCPGTAVVGRVYYIVDSLHNKTSTSTSYSSQVTFNPRGTGPVTSNVSDILASGSHIRMRTDVNAAGTVTYVTGTHTL